MTPTPAAPERKPWLSLWFTALVSLLAQLGLCQFFSFGRTVPLSIDVNPSNIWKYADHFPPRGEFLTLNWFGIPNLPPTLNPFSLAVAHLPVWLFFTAYAPFIATAALLAMALFLRELNLPRPAALLGAVVYAWQGDLLPFVFPGHYGYITTWPFFALAGWAALRVDRHWAHALIAGASCGMMIGLQPDRGAIASLLIAALYLAPLLRHNLWRDSSIATTPPRSLFHAPATAPLGRLALCAGTALLVSLAGFLALFQSNIVGVKLGGATDREQLFSLATQYSLGPAETFTYLAPGIFGWHSSSTPGPYWGWIGQTPGYEIDHQGARNLNLGISTIGTAGSILALLGAALLLPGAPRFFGWQGMGTGRRLTKTTASKIPLPSGMQSEESPSLLSSSSQGVTVNSQPARGEDSTLPTFDERQLFYGRLLFVLGLLALLLSWGYHTPLYRPLFALPLMDKWRNPLKWLGVFNFAAVVLAAYGAAHILRSLADATQRHVLALFFAVIVGLLFVLVLASYPAAIVVAGFLNAEGYAPEQIANVMHTLHVTLGVAFLVGGLLGLVVVGAWQADRLQRWDIVNPWLRRLWQRALAIENRPATLALSFALLVAGQLGWVATQFIEPISLAGLTQSNPLLDSLRSEGPLVRVAVPQPQDSLLNFYLQNQFAEFHLSSIDISAASRIPDDLSAFVAALDGQTARLWLLAGVKNVAIGQDDLTDLRHEPDLAANIAAADGYTLTPTTDDQPTHAIVRLRDYFAKATFIPSAELLPTKADVLTRVADPKWNPRETVLLARPDSVGQVVKAAAKAKLAPPPETAVNVTRYTAHQIDLTLTAPQAGYVLINDHFDPDWQVTLNGGAAPLLRADYLLRAVAVPAGPSRVTLRYVAHYSVAGLAIPVVLANDFSDGVMLLAFATGAILACRHRRRPDSQ